MPVEEDNAFPARTFEVALDVRTLGTSDAESLRIWRCEFELGWQQVRIGANCTWEKGVHHKHEERFE